MSAVHQAREVFSDGAATLLYYTIMYYVLHTCSDNHTHLVGIIVVNKQIKKTWFLLSDWLGKALVLAWIFLDPLYFYLNFSGHLHL